MIGRRRYSGRRKDTGVSEIIGDILILAMTVVLFSGIFFFVNTLPTPNAQTYANFQATLSPQAHGLTLLNITDEGGDVLSAGTTMIVVQINQSINSYTLSQGNTLVNGQLARWGAQKWGTNQLWSINLTGVSSSTIVTVSIINRANNFLVWSSVLSGNTGIKLPVIEDAYVNPDPARPGSSVAVYASIIPTMSNLNVSAFVNYLNPGLKYAMMSYNQTTGLWQSSTVTLSDNLKVGNAYPVIVTVSGPGNYQTNYSFTLSVERVGPDVVTASINPNPSTPGNYFNVTAYVVDSNTTYFNPNQEGNVTISPFSSFLLTNITKTDRMHPTPYQGVFTFEGKVDLNASGFETFVINATDTLGDYSTYFITLVVINSLNSGVQNTSYPSTYLGPTSMTFAGFKWTVANSTGAGTTYNSAFEIPYSAYESAPGIYFSVEVQNHNTSRDLYLDALTDIFLELPTAAARTGNPHQNLPMAFIDLNRSQGAPYFWNVTPSKSPPYSENIPPSPPTVTPASGGHSHPTPPPNKFNYNYNYSDLLWNSNTQLPETGVYWNQSFILLPAAVGGVAVNVTLTFGAGASGTDIPVQSGGPFIPEDYITAPTITIDYLLLFGYQLPAGTTPWNHWPQEYGMPFGQTIPFTSIFWAD